jgi:phenylalanyl-tRNA synthetase beta subunit
MVHKACLCELTLAIDTGEETTVIAPAFRFDHTHAVDGGLVEDHGAITRSWW